MSRHVLTTLDFNNVGRIANLPDGVNPQDPATVAQLASVNEGKSWKDSVRVATQGNVSIASPGAAIDGVTMAANDRVLVRAQTSQPENGLYIWNGAATPMTRALDASTAKELEQAIVSVEEGTSAGLQYRQTQVNFTLGSSNVVWTSFGTAAPPASETTAGIAEIATQAETDAGTDDARFVTPLKLKTSSLLLRKFSATFGDGSATQYTITHNFNTEDVQVEVYRTSGNKDTIICDVDRTSVNAVRLTFASAPASNAFRCVVIG